MKKYIFPALIIIAAILFCACSNDDITINRKFTISVDASGVPAPFKNIETSANTNNLSSLSDGFQLRVRVLVYNSEGKAIVSQQQYRDSYLDAGTPFSTELENGTYTFVAITDIVPPSSSVIKSIWTLKGETDINEAELICDYNMDINPREYGILGIVKRQISITQETQNITLQPTPAGALLLVTFNGLSTASSKGYDRFYLCTNVLPSQVIFKDDEAAISTHSDVTEGYLNGLRLIKNASKEKNDNETGDYMFFLPCQLRMSFAYALNDKLAPCGATLSQSLEAGSGYNVILDLVASNYIVDINSVVTFTQPSAGKASQPAPTRSLRLADVQ